MENRTRDPGAAAGRVGVSAVARGATILAIGAALGASLVLVAVGRIDPGQSGAIIAGSVGVLLYLARDRE